VILAGFYGLYRIGARRSPYARPPIWAGKRCYEFRNGSLTSDPYDTDILLGGDVTQPAAFDALARSIYAMHPDGAAKMHALKTHGQSFTLTGQFGPDDIVISGWQNGDRLIVDLQTLPPDHGTNRPAGTLPQQAYHELHMLRDAFDLCSNLIWAISAQGQITWANAAYFDLAEKQTGQKTPWPLPVLFDLSNAPQDKPHRIKFGPDDGHNGQTWFEVAQKLRQDGTTLCVAHPIDALVDAETAHQNFMQTLSVTFAQLPIGLAVFDKRRELISFNPALLKHSMIEAPFLLKRPTLKAFLDALRDRQRIPEPKDYRTWREDMSRLEIGAQNGTYQDIWTLPNGDTYRVMGRPQPDGALALLFEDITSGMSFTRQFQTDLALHQSALNAVPIAMIAFSRNHDHAVCNRAYSDLWGHVIDKTKGAIFADAVRIWRENTTDADPWHDLEQTHSTRNIDKTHQRRFTMKDGRHMQYQARIAPDGALILWFSSVNTSISHATAQIIS
jgi:PAS domain-containing protein